MTTLQNSINPTFGTTGQLWTSTGNNSLPTWSGFSMPLPIYQGAGLAWYAAGGLGHPIGNINPLNSISITAAYVYYIPFLCQSTHAFTAIGVYCITGQAASNITMGIYATPPGHVAAGGVVLPNSASGNVSSASSGAILQYTFGAPVTLNGGSEYWLAISCSSGAVVFAGINCVTNPIDYVNGANLNSLGPTNEHGLYVVQTLGAYSATLPSPATPNVGVSVALAVFPLIALLS